MFEIVFGCLLEVCVKMEWYVDVGKETLANELHILTQEKRPDYYNFLNN